MLGNRTATAVLGVSRFELAQAERDKSADKTLPERHDAPPVTYDAGLERLVKSLKPAASARSVPQSRRELFAYD